MSQNSASVDTCAYCGETGDLTGDHIPPKSVFPDDPKFRQQLIKVPACFQCNRSFSDDDQYLHFVTASHVVTNMNPISASLHARAHRGMARNRKIAQKSKFVGMMEAHTPDGSEQGSVPVVHVDHKALNRVMTRVVRGLYFHHFHQRVPDHLFVRCSGLSDPGLRDERIIVGYEMMLVPFKNPKVPDYDVGPGVFMYKYVGDQQRSAWLMAFYNGLEFIGSVGPNPTGGGATD